MCLRRVCGVVVAAVMSLALPPSTLAQSERPRPVVATPQFALFSDLSANLNDALLSAGRARRAKSQELFQTGAEKACFDKLTAAERAGWVRAVDYYAEIIVPFDVNAREQNLFRIELMAGSEWATGDDRSFMAIARNIRAAATAAYERCRWPAQDASNRRWIERTAALLKVHGRILGDRLAQLYGAQWVGLPYRVDVVESVSQLGGNTQSFVPAGPHILVSSSAAANQDLAALELLFHEASHVLAGPMQEALRRAVRARGDSVRGDFAHAVIFYLSGEAVRRVLEQAGESYMPWLYKLQLVPDNVRDALSRTLSPYLGGQGTLDQALDNFVLAVTSVGR